MTLNHYPSIPCVITLDRHALDRVPYEMRRHAANGGRLYVVERPEHGRALVCVSPNPDYAACTYVDERLVTPVDLAEDPRDLSFVAKDAEVWYVRPACEDEPVRQGTVTTIYPDGSVELWDDYLGAVDAGLNDLYRTRKDAEAAFARR